MASMADRVGQQLGNYRLVRLLGRGGFAEVYLGEHIYLKSQAAIKVLHTQLANEDMETFLSEARTLAILVHPHIVRVLDFGLEGNTPFIVMDYAPNGTLRQRYPKGTQLPLPVIVDYVKQVAEALQYAHNLKVIHRDIKPENMLIGRNNEILLSDFGIAIVAQSSRYSINSEMAGTIAYMAPEQIQSHPRPASDQYALGIVVYEWLSGQRPFQGSFTEIAAKQAMVSPPPLREKVPSISPAIEQVMQIALEKDPSRRFANVSMFALALEQASGTGQFQSLLGRDSSLDESSLATFVTPTSSATIITPSNRQQQPSITPIPPFYPNGASTSLPSGGTSPTLPNTVTRKKRTRLVMILGLVGLFVLGFLIVALVFSARTFFTASPTPSSTSPIVATAPPSATLPLSPTLAPSPTVVQSVYPNIAGNYTGSIHNTYADIYSTMSLSINQDQGTISGQFTVAYPLQGSGPFTGTIFTNSSLTFLVHSNDTAAPILFQGTWQADGSLSGTYCSVNAQNQCDTNAGGHGVWSVTKSTAAILPQFAATPPIVLSSSGRLRPTS